MTADARGPDRTLLLLGAAILALVVIAAVAVLLLGGRGAESFPPDSPEGVLQRHLAAFDDGDLEAAHAFFSSEVRGQMDLDAYEQMSRDYGMAPPDGSRRVLFDSTEIDGERARVHLTVEEYFGGGPFGGGETYRSPREIRMVREEGSWRIDDTIVGVEPVPVPGIDPFGP
jgi:hypothetical protein